MENDIDNKKPILTEIAEIKNSKNVLDKVKNLQPSLTDLINSQKKDNPKRSKIVKVKNSKNHNSISSENNEKQISSPTKYRMQKKRLKAQNNEHRNNTKKKKTKTTQSNYLLSTNDTLSKESHKKIKYKKKYNFEISINNNDNNKKNNIENGIDFENYENLFKNVHYKKTIIIDKDGNNNLNWDKTDQSYNSDRDSLFINSISKYPKNKNTIVNNSNFANKEDYMKRATSIDIIEEKNRLNEYNRIFNLLNSNIEQFKNIFMKNTHFSNNKEDNRYKNDKKNKNNKKKLGVLKANSSTKKQKLNVSKSEKILLNIIQSNSHNKFESKNNLDIINTKKNKGSADLSNSYSFLESCLQDDFYQSLLNNTILEEDKGSNEKNVNFDKEIWDKYDIYEHTQKEIFDGEYNQKCAISPRKLIKNNEDIVIDTQEKNGKLNCDSKVINNDGINNYNNAKTNNIDGDNNNKCFIF